MLSVFDFRSKKADLDRQTVSQHCMQSVLFLFFSVRQTHGHKDEGKCQWIVPIFVALIHGAGDITLVAIFFSENSSP